MYLKEIKASGFKSFADKININLNDEITCVVGPNGSGKSNIVDAVKWVLGEQSVKTLRGDGAMTDVIFSGSKSRNPLNLASVTLIFDNTDGYLKVPYTEISVTRKVFRSGENEYYLNNEKCRLKDINDLFLDSGIGKYAFNIISQGEISNIIDSSPYERRAILEEAAGVLKYKKRKEEALRKLDKTNENMTRIKDIIAELDTQIMPLKEQKENALIYLDLEKKLKDIEIALIASDLEKLNESYHKNEEEKEKLEEEIAKEMTSSSSSDLNSEKLKTSLITVNETITTTNKKLLELTREIEKLNGDINILKERSKYKSDDIKVHENITNLKETKYTLNNKLLSLKSDIATIETNLNELNKKIETKSILNNKIKEEKENITNEIFSTNKNITNTTYHIKTLTDYIEQGAGININVKKVLSNPKLKGIHNTIGNLIKADEDYVTSITAILGGAKDFVVVDTKENAKQAINYLKENNLGRVTFFPLEVIKERFIDIETQKMLRSEQGYIGILSDLINYEEKYQNIIKNQLGNVIVVNSIDDANRVSKKINNKYRIVTLSGEVINIGGSITGGKLKTSSIIKERYELNKLISTKTLEENKLIELNKTLEQVTSKTDQLKEEIYNLEKEKMLLENEKTAKKTEYNKCSEIYKEKETELNNLEGLISGNNKTEEEQLMEIYYKKLQEKDDFEKKLNQLLKEKENFDNELEQAEATFKLSNTKIRQLESKLKECEISNSKTSVKMDNLLNILSETYQMTYEKAKENFILEIDEVIARKNVNDYRRKLKEIGVVNISSIEEFDRVNTRYEFLKKQFSDLEEASISLLKIIEELDLVMKNDFKETFKKVQIEFDKTFKELFKGGTAKLELTNPNDMLTTGVQIIVTPPGKKLTSINLLSGGEKTLTAISLLFAILNIKKIPFCIFDEIEAALDEANVVRVGEYFHKYKGKTQLIIITHKKKTMEYANNLYGITMQESGVSKLVSVKLV